MGNKYSASLSKYPYKGYPDKSIRGKYLIPFIIKLIVASFKYEIIDIFIRRR